MARISFMLLGVLALYIIFSSRVLGHSYGAPSGFTGSPVDGRTCATPSCHSGPPKLVEGWVSTDIPLDGFLPGETYVLTFTSTRPDAGRYGFQASILDTTKSQAGAFSIYDATQTQLGTGAHYVTHTATGSYGANGSKTWDVMWTAPSTYPLWPLTLYAAFVAGDSLSNDSVYLTHIRLFPKSMGIMENSQQTCLNAIASNQTLRVLLPVQPYRAKIELFKLSGQCIFMMEIEPGQAEISIPVSGIRGMHIIRLESKLAQCSMKLLL